ncbi:MAG: T9SS type A sorting domain-containing protein [Bacteroidetes bacterium]|nr:T9SS type A sorting domain-containing protein [Bacteroidota bacterium]
MKLLYPLIVTLCFVLPFSFESRAQACGSAQGDQSTFGANNVWIGYAYTGTNFNNYMGYVTEGSSSSPNFDENFGGDNVSYSTNGCSLTTEQFSMRYKLRQTFNGSYTITLSGDDGYRLSVDGGSTWIINNWGDHPYATSTLTVSLSGSTDMVLEYYENGGGNRVTFNMVFNCVGSGNPTQYGSNNVWVGHLYQGTNFDTYKGYVTEGTSTNPTFDESFGTSNGQYNTNSCFVMTEQFSARYRLQQNLPYGNYVITVGGDDGYRFSLDGGSTWVINNWGDHGYVTTTYTATLSGAKNMVLEYYENGGENRVSFAMSSTLLPVTLTSWTATALSDNQALLKWTATNAVSFDRYVVQRSTDGSSFQDVYSVTSSITSGVQQDYSYTDPVNYNGTVYYRLAMVDIDGATKYSSIVTLNFAANKSAHIYPTVVENGQVFIETPKAIYQARLEVFDMNGRRLQEKSWPSLEGRQQVMVTGNGNTLPAGAYLARLSDGQSTIAKQIIIVK